MSSNNVRHLITRTITTLQHFAALHHTSPTHTSLHHFKYILIKNNLKNMKECDNSKIRISSNFLLFICLLIMLDTLLLGPSLHCNTSLHFTTLHQTTLHCTYKNVGHLITSTTITLLHFATLHHTSSSYTSLHLSTLHFLSFTLHLHFWGISFLYS